MGEAIQGVGQHGRVYWCIKTDLARDGEIHVLADRIEVAPSGALIAWGSYRVHESEPHGEPSVNLVCAPGRWSGAYLARRWTAEASRSRTGPENPRTGATAPGAPSRAMAFARSRTSRAESGQRSPMVGWRMISAAAPGAIFGGMGCTCAVARARTGPSGAPPDGPLSKPATMIERLLSSMRTESRR